MSLIRSIYITFVIVTFGAINGQSQVPVTFDVGSGSGVQGAIVCVDFTVEDFLKVTSIQYVIRFDPKVLVLQPLDLSNSALNANGANGLSTANFNILNSDQGYVNFTWFDAATNGITLLDGDILFTFCFEIIGDPCDISPICITESGSVPFEVAQIDCITGEDIEFPPIINKGEVTVDPDGYEITAAFCSSDDIDNTGSITFAGTGGVGPYSWSIIPGSASGNGLADCEEITVDGLAPGMYTITFIDAMGTLRNEIVNIVTSSEFPFILALKGTDPTCFDKKNGLLMVDSIQGGEAPFTYEWSTFQFDEDMINKLGTGDYGLTITDLNGCTTSAEFSLNVDTLKLSYNVISDPTCDGSSNGIVSILAEGGTPYPGGNYIFDIDGINGTIYFGGTGNNPTNPFTPGNLPAGCFEAVASDNATIACFSDPIEFCIEAGSFSQLTIDTTSISCFGACDGEVLIVASDVGNYSFMITGPNGSAVSGMNTNVAFDTDGLCPGLYMVKINDVVAGCSKDTFFTILEPTQLVLSVQDSIGPGCGGGDGRITFATAGGSPSYSYLWNDGYIQATRINMGGGNYSVTVTDTHGCKDSLDFVFADGGDIGLSAIVCQAVSCGGAMDGSACANVTAMGNYTFTWADVNGNDLGTGAQINNLGGGIYYVTATDGMCTDTDTVIMAPGDTPSVNIVQNDPTCIDSNDGTLTATLATGTSPGTFEWTQPPSTAVLSMGAVLFDGVGVYNIHIVDGNGCTADTLVEMLPPANSIQVSVSNIIDNPCFGQCEGSATFTASGGPDGSGNYVYFISGVSGPINGGSPIVSNVLCGGMNWVYAIDGICASDTVFFMVPDAVPVELNIAQSMINPPSCDGGDDGSITVVMQGGNSSNYDIFWINEGISGPALSNLVSGQYIYSITDGSNCITMDTILLETPDPLEVEVNPFTTVDLNCFSSTMGRIGLLVSGGNSGLRTYSWSPNVSNTDFANNIGPGLYLVTVTDSKGCTASTSYELTSANAIQAVVNVPAEPDCFGGETCIGIDTAFGGVGMNFTFTINNGPRYPLDTCINVFAGPYLLTVFDSAGCSMDTMVTINQPTQILVDLGPDITIDLGDFSDPVSASIVSELDIDSIVWNPISDLVCNTIDCQVVTFSPLATTTYTITVTDENGCFASDEITVFVDLARNVYAPNIFSPNGDNRNDMFQLATGAGVVEVEYLRLFDRWGNLMYQDQNYVPDDSLHPGWDGTYNGVEVEPGVYVYIAQVMFQDGVRVSYKGDITVVR